MNIFYKTRTYFFTDKFKILHNFSTNVTSKIYNSRHEAVQDIPSGSTLLVGGFGVCGIPENLIGALYYHHADNFTVISNNVGIDMYGIGLLIHKKKINRVIASYVGENNIFRNQFLRGDLELELVPQGTLVERIRAGGAGIPAFFTRTAFGTTTQEGGVPIKYDKAGNIDITSEPKVIRIFKEKEYVMERAIKGDYALIKAKKGDTGGNLVFNKTARNFNPAMAKAAKITIAEVEELVELGCLDPEEIHLPGIYVDRIIQGDLYQKCIEKTTVRDAKREHVTKCLKESMRECIAKRAVLELNDGIYNNVVNLGTGIPMLIPKHIPKDINVIIQSEIGVLGVGPYPRSCCIDSDCINAAKETISIKEGASFFSSDDSFGMIRGGHIDVIYLEATEVSQFGDISNWLPESSHSGMGAVMDLVAADHTKIVVCMEHTSKNGSMKILEECQLPLVGKRCVDVIITEKCIFHVHRENGLELIELANGVQVEDVMILTGCQFHVAENLKRIRAKN